MVLVCLARTSLANLRLSRRFWSASRPLESGWVVVPTGLTGGTALCAFVLLA